MRPWLLELAFLRFLASRGVRIEVDPPRSGIECMLEFYASKRLSGVAEDDGDMLLLLVGSYDWGHGPSFELDLTRQSMARNGAMRQLHLTYRFAPSPLLSAIEEGSRWCHAPEELDEFTKYVRGHAVWQAVQSVVPRSVVLDLDAV